MKNKYFKIYKLNQLQKIKQTYKYIYIFRYYDLTLNEIIFIKKKLKEFNYKSLILNQNLIEVNNIFKLNIKAQGSILIIYSNKNLDLIKNILNLKKIELLFLKLKNNIYSNLKINKIILNSNINISLNILLIKPFLNFLYYLRKI